jgi:DNA-nicking Smr family endonuclease|tara:strand:+ start:955 stop:1371 length:417 start_codon:yes stop_codon:yes gene_type:complete
LNKKISEKDIKDWKEFTESNSKIENKDIDFVQLEKISNRTLDLHGLTLEIANKKIEQFIKSSFDKNVEKITVITGKGLRSKVDQNPYQSKDLSILKYSVPEFIRNNLELMSLIKKIDDRTENKNSGSFTIHLKSKNKL